ncbi:uncharacterized protein LOC141633742 isoform X2 [Silene latifolia]|uniref:uncharacterized protein LOC141633742 isoform X2 n=1 Tax=Silene latifolia TaxID=37657 RepID=UPI003D788FBF
MTSDNTQVCIPQSFTSVTRSIVRQHHHDVKLPPSLLLRHIVPGGHKCIEFGSIRTGGASIMVHALLQFGLCIKDCDQTVERGRELRSDHKMVARALTRKGTTLVKLAKMVQWRIWVWFMDCNLGLFCIFRQDEDEARSLR